MCTKPRLNGHFAAQGAVMRVEGVGGEGRRAEPHVAKARRQPGPHRALTAALQKRAAKLTVKMTPRRFSPPKQHPTPLYSRGTAAALLGVKTQCPRGCSPSPVSDAPMDRTKSGQTRRKWFLSRGPRTSNRRPPHAY